MVHRGVHLFFRAVWLCLVLVLVAIGAFIWRLSQGPVPLDFLTEYVGSPMGDGPDALRFKFGSAELSWVEFQSIPRIEAQDVEVLNPSDTVIAILPNAVIDVSVPQLFTGNVVPVRVAISEPIVRVTRYSDGRVTLGFNATRLDPTELEQVSEGEEPAADGRLAARLIAGLIGQRQGSEDIQGLREVSVRESTVIFSDFGSGRRWIIPDANFELKRDQSGLNLSASLPVTSGNQISDVEIVGRYAERTGTLSLTVGAEGLVPGQFADLAPQLKPLDAIDARLDGDVSASLLLDGDFVFVNWIRFDLRSQEGNLAVPEPVLETYGFRNFNLRGTAGRDLDRIIVESLNVEVIGEGGKSATVRANALGSQLNSLPKIEASAAIESMTVEELTAVWPKALKVNTRGWIKNNLSDGSLYGLTAQVSASGESLREIGIDAFGLQTGIEKLTVQYIKGLPPVRDVFGVLNIDLKSLVITVGGGSVNGFGESEPLTVEGGTVTFNGLDEARQVADLTIDVNGRVNDILKLIDLDPLGYASATGILPEAASGFGQTRLGMSFPLLAALKLDQIEFDVAAALTNVTLKKAALDQDLTDGQLALRLTGDGMVISGPANLGGISMGLTWEQAFKPGPFSSRVAVDAVIDEDERSVIGLTAAPLTAPYIKGPMRADALYTVSPDGGASLQAEIDLAQAQLDFSELGWVKPIGEPGTANVSARFENGTLASIDQFSLTAPAGLQASGQADFSADGQLTRLAMPDTQVGRSTFSLSYLANPGTESVLQLSGQALDATRIWDALRRAPTARPEPEEPDADSGPMKITVNFDRLWFDPDKPFSNVSAEIKRDNGQTRRLDFLSEFEGNQKLGAKLRPVESMRQFQIESSNAGAALSALGLYDDIVGGELQIAGQLDDAGAINGIARITNYQLVRAPLVARLLSVAALTGILDELNGRGISFGQLEVPFTYADEILSLQDAGAFGSSIGLTASGNMNMSSGAMDIRGTLVPAYALNSALGNIPVVGPIFSGGEKGSGVFAANYSIRGQGDQAEIAVNPLSALAPGFLRRVFSMFDQPSAVAQQTDPEVGDVETP